MGPRDWKQLTVGRVRGAGGLISLSCRADTPIPRPSCPPKDEPQQWSSSSRGAGRLPEGVSGPGVRGTQGPAADVAFVTKQLL